MGCAQSAQACSTLSVRSEASLQMIKAPEPFLLYLALNNKSMLLACTLALSIRGCKDTQCGLAHTSLSSRSCVSLLNLLLPIHDCNKQIHDQFVADSLGKMYMQAREIKA